MEPVSVPLDPSVRCAEAVEFEADLALRLVGQPEAVAMTSEIVQTFMAGFNPANRPVGVMLMLGPTGTGKTKLVETVASILFNNPKAIYKISCAEYQDSYQTNRLLGSPPGYVGHDEKKKDGMLTQEKLDKYQTSELKLNLVLLDEIEKANESLTQLFLNILDKGEIALSNGQVVDFSKSIIFMTSNLGAEQMGKSIGFSREAAAKRDLDNRQVIETAVKHKLSPEFRNRIDHEVIFRTLLPEHLHNIFELELQDIRLRFQMAAHQNKFVFHCSHRAEDAIIADGFNPKYGARHLKRVIERHLVQPLAAISMSGQLNLGDLVVVDYDGKFSYRKYNGDEVGRLTGTKWVNFKTALAS